MKLGKKAPEASGTGLGGLVTVAEPRSPASEAYRTLRTNIQFASLEPRVLMREAWSVCQENQPKRVASPLAIFSGLRNFV